MWAAHCVRIELAYPTRYSQTEWRCPGLVPANSYTIHRAEHTRRNTVTLQTSLSRSLRNDNACTARRVCVRGWVRGGAAPGGCDHCRHLFKNYIRKKGTRGTPSKIQLVFESTPQNAPRLPIQNQQSYHTSLVNYIVEYVRTYSWM